MKGGAKGTRTCQTCGDHHMRAHCPSCGEKVFSTDDLSVARFIRSSVEGITHFEGKFFRTMRLLLTEPGALTRNWVHGIRVPYMKPIPLFIVVNLAVFLLLKNTSLFFTPPAEFHNKEWHFAWLEADFAHVIQQGAAAHNISEAGFLELVASRLPSFAKGYLIALIPVLGLLLWPVLPKGIRHFSVSMVFSIHVSCWLILLLTLLTLILGGLGIKAIDDRLIALVLVAICIYLALALRRAFATTWLRAASTAVFFGIAMLLTWVVYRIAITGAVLLVS
jgi:Protein of unknown function (DUF3667)